MTVAADRFSRTPRVVATIPGSLRAWLLVIVVWQLVGLAGTLVLALTSGGFHPFTDRLTVGLTFTNLFGGLASVVAYVVQRAGSRLRLGPRMVLSSLGLVIVAVVASAASVDVGRRVCKADGFRVDRLHLLMASVDFVLLAAVALGAAAVLIYRRLSADLARRHEEQARLERLQLETQLNLLQAKVNPHFLFNTLSSMLELVRSDPSQVEGMILNLADIYRKVLTWPATARVPLGDEFDLVRQYLEIERIRMGPRLAFTLDMHPDLRELGVPPLIVEILVENAVRHGIAARASGGTITVTAHPGAGQAIIEVVDDGVGPGVTEAGTGFGLFSVRQRLQLVYGADAELRVQARPGGGTHAVIQVPHAH
jgi:two-component system, LytTR family, sensor kinase